MNERIKELRKVKGLTQQMFAERIGVSRNNIATYETGKSNPGEAAISLICKTFNVNEKWLRTGEGEMFIKQSRDDELTKAVNTLLGNESSEFKKRLIVVLSKLNIDQWEALEQLMNEIVNGRSPLMTPEQEARDEAEKYYQELLQEKRVAAGLLASPDVKEA